jgi:uncharacterized protein YeaO (DUF488 family)
MDKAKKYRTLLRKRDKEVMDLVVESKELRTTVEKEHKKYSDFRSKHSLEINNLKDDLSSQIKRS